MDIHEAQHERAFQKQQSIFLGNKRALLKKQKDGKITDAERKKIRYWKSVGLGFTTPRTAIEGTYIDKKCPFTGQVSIRGRILRGVVKSTSMKRTVVVRREYLKYVSKFNRYEKRHKNIPAHCSPAFEVKVGDEVVIGECRPLTKTVRFNVLKVAPVVQKKKFNVCVFNRDSNYLCKKMSRQAEEAFSPSIKVSLWVNVPLTIMTSVFGLWGLHINHVYYGVAAQGGCDLPRVIFLLTVVTILDLVAFTILCLMISYAVASTNTRKLNLIITVLVNLFRPLYRRMCESNSLECSDLGIYLITYYASLGIGVIGSITGFVLLILIKCANADDGSFQLKD
ncbi:ribosomal protein S11 [Acrasis kona]|uniref:Small ribosomal subunit protein uS17 n=1 Tax=Acrasis kona TaxID=1008807 RepID=A0AAW2ZDE6_9EUKA